MWVLIKIAAAYGKVRQIKRPKKWTWPGLNGRPCGINYLESHALPLRHRFIKVILRSRKYNRSTGPSQKSTTQVPPVYSSNVSWTGQTKSKIRYCVGKERDIYPGSSQEFHSRSRSLIHDRVVSPSWITRSQKSWRSRHAATFEDSRSGEIYTWVWKYAFIESLLFVQ